MATETIIYVDADGTKDYTSLHTALATEAKDLVTADEYIRFICTGVNTQESVTVSNSWTTSTTCYISIEAGTGDEALLTEFDTSRYYIGYDFNGRCLYLQVDNVHFENLQVKRSTTNGDSDIITVSVNSPSNIIFNNCRFLGGITSTGSAELLSTIYSNVSVQFYTCIIEKIKNIDDAVTYPSTLFDIGATGTITAYNCNFVDCDIMDSGAGTFNIVNSISANPITDFSITTNISNCATETGLGTDGVTITDWTTVFTDYANGDYTTLATATELRDAGLGPDADPLVPIEDWDGNVISGLTCTIGISELDAVVTHTLTYDGNGNDGGTVPIDGSSPYETGSSVTILGNTGSLTLTGYIFVAWNTASDGTGTNLEADDIYTINEDTVLYALWKTEAELIEAYLTPTTVGGRRPRARYLGV